MGELKNEMKTLVLTESDAILIDRQRLVKIPVAESYDAFLTRRGGGEFQGNGFFLNSDYTWEIGIDSHGLICLLPLKP